MTSLGAKQLNGVKMWQVQIWLTENCHVCACVENMPKSWLRYRDWRPRSTHYMSWLIVI